MNLLFPSSLLVSSILASASASDANADASNNNKNNITPSTSVNQLSMSKNKNKTDTDTTTDTTISLATMTLDDATLCALGDDNGGDETKCPTCLDSEELMKVLIFTDNWADEISWNVVNMCTNPVQVIMEHCPYEWFDDRTPFGYVMCVPKGAEYEFTIFDSAGDGLGSFISPGYYTFTYGNETVFGGYSQGGGFFSVECTSFGTCQSGSRTLTPGQCLASPPSSCPTPSPTVIPTKSKASKRAKRANAGDTTIQASFNKSGGISLSPLIGASATLALIVASSTFFMF